MPQPTRVPDGAIMSLYVGSGNSEPIAVSISRLLPVMES